MFAITVLTPKSISVYPVLFQSLSTDWERFKLPDGLDSSKIE
jgi:hypothetical protein